MLVGFGDRGSANAACALGNRAITGMVRDLLNCAPTMSTKALFASAAIVAILAATPALAHHSANAEFDTQKVMTITGVLTKLEVVNPHSWWQIEVKEPDGKITSWRLESNSPAGLIRLGVKVKTEVKVGETYGFRISPAWKDPDGSKLGWMRAFTINGKEYVLTEL